MISHCVGQETNIYHLNKGEIPKLHRINMDIEKIKVGKDTYSLIEWLRIFKNEYSNLRSFMAGTNFIELTFEEDIQADVTVAYKKVCSFLNIESYKVDAPFSRTNPFKIEDIVININEVENLLKGSEFSWMLRD